MRRRPSERERVERVALGRVLRRLRCERGLTQAQAAAGAGVSGEAYRCWEYGRACPSALALRRLLGLLARSADELWAEHGHLVERLSGGVRCTQEVRP